MLRGRPFLTAQWTNLFLATYAVSDDVLLPLLPAGLELDRRKGLAHVSLVAFDFCDTRILGIPWPGFRTFPEVNLRFYVRRGPERGVVFVREFVPSRLIAWAARRLYNEPYVSVPMTSAVTETAETLSVEHRLIGRHRTDTIRATGMKPGLQLGPETVEHFFKEHQWGYGRTRRGVTLRYEVRHPVWEVYPVRDFHIEMDWAALYGPEWAFLQEAAPVSTILAAGSVVAVFPHGRVVGP